mmetsp:Transcript_3689/g.8041  ORF Transcript_3689/g.8041 Transcript_3689/m.8041 type:complete len:360 (-) Transcript_3689:224-1303(-)
MADCNAAPRETDSSAFMVVDKVFTPKISNIFFLRKPIRVLPPTISTEDRSALVILASSKVFWMGAASLARSGAHISSYSVFLQLDIEVEVVHQTFEVDEDFFHALRTEGFLRLFCGCENLQHHLGLVLWGARKFLTVFLNKLGRDPVTDRFIKVSAPQVVVEVARFNDEFPGLECRDRHRVSGGSHVHKHNIGRRFLREFLADVLENSVGQGRCRVLVHQSLDARDPNYFATIENGPSLRVCVIRWNSNNPILREQGVYVGKIGSRGFRGFFCRDHSHVVHDHSQDLFDRNGGIRHLDADRGRASRRMGKGDAFVRNSFDFLLRSRIVERKPDETLHVLDRGLEFRNRGRSGDVFSHSA